MQLDELKKYIPKFLPDGEQDDLFSDLKQILTSGDLKNFYSVYGTEKEAILDQGDCIKGLPIFNLPNTDSSEGKGFILSNPCDTNPSNARKIPMRVLYAPVLNLVKYEELLKRNGKYSEAWGQAVRKQQITHLFYLPKGRSLDYEAIVPLDHIHSISEDVMTPQRITEDRVFQLSRSAWYTFLIKITHHFARTNQELLFNRSPVHNP